MTSDINSNATINLSAGQWGLINVVFQAPPARIPIQLWINQGFSGNINATNCTVSGTAATFPAGQVAYSVFTSDSRYQLSGTTLSNNFYPLYSNPSNYVNNSTLLSASNSLQSQIVGGAVTLNQVTNIVNSQTNGLATTNWVGTGFALISTTTASGNNLTNLINLNGSNATNNDTVVSNGVSALTVSATNPIPGWIQNQAISSTNFAMVVSNASVQASTNFSASVALSIVNSTSNSFASGAAVVGIANNAITANGFVNTNVVQVTNYLQTGLSGTYAWSGVDYFKAGSHLYYVAPYWIYKGVPTYIATNFSGALFGNYTNGIFGITVATVQGYNPTILLYGVDSVQDAVNLTNYQSTNIVGTTFDLTNSANTVGLNLTNLVYTNSINISNTIASLVVGGNGTALTNLIYTNSINLTNFILSTGLGLTNLIYTNGINGSNLIWRIGGNDTNFSMTVSNAAYSNATNAPASLSAFNATNQLGSGNLMAYTTTNYWASLIQTTNIVSGNAIANFGGTGTNTTLTNAFFIGVTNFTALSNLNFNGFSAINMKRIDQSQNEFMIANPSLGNGMSANLGNISMIIGGASNVVGSSASSQFGVAVINSAFTGNTTSASQWSTIIGALGGGMANCSWSTMLGTINSTVNANYCLALGSNVFIPFGDNNVFIWSDGSKGQFSSTSTNQVLFNTLNGFGINTNSPGLGNLGVNGDIVLNGISISKNETSISNQLAYVRSWIGNNTNYLITTVAGTSNANGTNVWSGVGNGSWTNINGLGVITNNSGNIWSLYVSGVAFYNTTNPPVGSPWFTTAGTAPAPSTAFAPNPLIGRTNALVSYPVGGTFIDVPSVNGGISTTTTNFAGGYPQFDILSNGYVRLPNGTLTNFPSSTTFGFMECQALAGPTLADTNGICSGFKIVQGPGVFHLQSQISISNNCEWSMVPYGGTVIVYDNTNGFTINQMTNSVSWIGAGLNHFVTNNISSSVIRIPVVITNSGYGFSPFGPSVFIHGGAFTVATNMPGWFIYSLAQNLLVDNTWFGNAGFLTDPYGQWHVGISGNGIGTNPPTMCGILMQGQNHQRVENCFFDSLGENIHLMNQSGAYYSIKNYYDLGTGITDPNGLVGGKKSKNGYPTNSILSIGCGVSVGASLITVLDGLNTLFDNVGIYIQSGDSGLQPIINSQDQGSTYPLVIANSSLDVKFDGIENVYIQTNDAAGNYYISGNLNDPAFETSVVRMQTKLDPTQSLYGQTYVFNNTPTWGWGYDVSGSGNSDFILDPTMSFTSAGGSFTVDKYGTATASQYNGNGSGITSVHSDTLLVVSNEDFSKITINQYYTNKTSRRLSINVDEVLTSDASHVASLGFYISTNSNISWTCFRTNSDPVVIAGSETKSFGDFIMPNWVYMITNLDASGITTPSTVSYTHRSYQ
ncbi:MAG: hypothetical protein KGL39_10230 [Patescibacteria group bacterium]|nr:hypothetical protein [Patescibacteria group bacterium]